MGLSILMVAFVIEVAFATYCIVTKSNHNPFRSVIRIGALARFVLFTLVSIIEWSMRWYGLAALLLVWAALGMWKLIGKHNLTPRTTDVTKDTSSIRKATWTEAYYATASRSGELLPR